MDRHFEDRGCNDTNLRLKPSESFRRRGWIAFEPVEGSLSVLADYIGPEKILWATDYPHPDGFFPGAPDLIAKRPELSEATKRKILAEGVMQFYQVRAEPRHSRDHNAAGGRNGPPVGVTASRPARSSVKGYLDMP